MTIIKAYFNNKELSSIYLGNIKTKFSNNTTDYVLKTTKSGRFYIHLSSYNNLGKTTIINFGNGYSTTINLTTIPQTISASYTDSSEKSISISNPDTISTLDCNSMAISELNISRFINLEKIVCYNNLLNNLDLSNNKIIQYIHCFNNPLILNDQSLTNMIKTLPDRNNKAFGSIIIDNRAQMSKVEPISIKKDWLFGSSIMYDPVEWAKCGYHFKQIGVADIWESGDKGDDIVIGLIDVGFDLKCQEYPLNCIIGTRNFSTQGGISDVLPPTSGNINHGNRTSSIIIAKGYKMYGIAPLCKLYLMKVSGANSASSSDLLTSAINYAKTQNINIISLSLNSTASYSPLFTAVKNFCSSTTSYLGRPLVNSAGNTGDNNPSTNDINYPAFYQYPISVGSIDINNNLASNSSSYAGVDIVSYGVNIIKQESHNSYNTSSGTSYSAPIVAAILALLSKIFIKKYGRTPSESELYNMLIKRTISMPKDSKEVGVGRLQLMSYN